MDYMSLSDMPRDEDGFIKLIPKKDLPFMKSRFEQTIMTTETKEIVFHHGYIAITNYKKGDNPEFEKSLSTFDKVNWRYNFVGGYYVPEYNELRVNRGFNPQVLMRYFPGYKMRVQNDPFPHDKVDIELYTPPRDDFQKVALTFMTSQGMYAGNSKITQQLISANPGMGKALPDDTPVLTPSGWRRMDSLQVGDYVLNRKGKPVEVLNVFPQGKRDAYEITVKDIDGYHSVICDVEHLWWFARYGKHYVRETWMIKDIFNTCDLHNRDSVPKIPRYHPEIAKKMTWCPIVDINMIGTLSMRCILIDDPEHLFIAGDNFITHNTYCGIATVAYWQKKVVIFVPFSKLLGQWKQSVLDYTNIKEKEILIVQGSDMCQKILDGKYKHIKVFIFMVDTVLSFKEREGNLKTMDMLKATGAYIKIIDEVHRDMKSVAMIEALSNFRMNYYLSASPGRADRKENWMFNTLFYGAAKFGNKFKKEEERHINVMIKKYYWTPTQQQIKNMVNLKTGLNTKAYERELINSPPQQRKNFEDALAVILNWIKTNIKKDKKVLVLAQAIDTLYYLQGIVEKVFPGKTSIYYGGMKPKEKEEALTHDIIIATSSSLGTGADIKGLQFAINCSTYSNKIDAIQLSGRTREIAGIEVVYIEMVNFGYLKTARQYENRRPTLLKQAKHGKLMIVN